jgi:hypothetical protein
MHSEKTCSSATLSTTNPTRPYPGSNSGLSRGKPVTNRLNDGTALNLPVVMLSEDIICEAWVHSDLETWGRGEGLHG